MSTGPRIKVRTQLFGKNLSYILMSNYDYNMMNETFVGIKQGAVIVSAANLANSWLRQGDKITLYNIEENVHFADTCI